MTKNFGRARVLLRVVAITALLFAFARPAFAGNVDELISQLGDDSDKIRLSAALNLTKLGDPKAIPALIKRLDPNVESSKNVRGAAAKGLGSLAANASKAQKAAAAKALTDAKNNDPSPFVTAQAEQALDKIGSVGGTTQPSGTGCIYVNVGPMSSKTGSNDAKFRDMMVKTSQKTLTRVASNMLQTWSGGGVPTKSQLQSKGCDGFYVDGTLNELKVEKSGNTATISCKVSMLLASFPDKSVFGFLNGGAKVQGSTAQRDIDLGSEDCVSAVVEDLIAKKIVPTIKSKVGP
jgi:hypothetical protein